MTWMDCYNYSVRESEGDDELCDVEVAEEEGGEGGVQVEQLPQQDDGFLEEGDAGESAGDGAAAGHERVGQQREYGVEHELEVPGVADVGQVVENQVE